MRFTQAIERIETLLTGQAVRGQPVPPVVVPPVPPPQPEVSVAPVPVIVSAAS